MVSDGNCGPGGTNTDGSNTGTAGTVPVGGGSSSSYTDPCNSLKAILNKKLDNMPAPQNSISDLVKALDADLPANNPQNNGTHELSFQVNEIGNTGNYEVTAYQSAAVDENFQATLTIANGFKYIFFGHDHPSNLSIANS